MSSKRQIKALRSDNMGIHHFGLTVAPYKFEETLSFYLECLKPLGYKELMRPAEHVVGMGAGFTPDFWVSKSQDAPESSPHHIAFWARSKAK